MSVTVDLGHAGTTEYVTLYLAVIYYDVCVTVAESLLTAAVDVTVEHSVINCYDCCGIGIQTAYCTVSATTIHVTAYSDLALGAGTKTEDRQNDGSPQSACAGCQSLHMVKYIHYGQFSVYVHYLFVSPTPVRCQRHCL